MNAETCRHESLERAFRSFERAAQTLQQRHASLQSKVERLERELLDASRRLEAVLDALDGGIAVVDREGRTLRTNRAFRERGLLGSDDRPNHAEIERLLRGAASSGSAARFRAETPDGQRDLAATVVPLGDGDGARLLTVHDVTEIRREEREGGRRRRLEALGRMAAELAHEVRNPLGSIRLYTCMLQEDLARQPDQLSMVEQVLAATAGLEGTVTNLLAFARPPKGAWTRFDLRRVAADVCALLQPACSARGVRLDGPRDDRSRAVEGDPEAIRQLVLNLLGNALAATGDGGRIVVSVESNGARITLRVDDDGKGIEPEDLPRVFDPFFSRTDGGTGLGLSIVHRTVERHGGRIALDSAPGRGTRIEVVLPEAGAQGEEVSDG